MKELSIEQTEFTSRIYFNPDKNIFLISGESRPENAEKFFQPVFDWLNSNKQALAKNKNFFYLEMHLDYYNSSTARCLIRIFDILEKWAMEKIPVKVKWFYMKNDESLYEQGKEYSILNPKLPFELVCLEEA